MFQRRDRVQRRPLIVPRGMINNADFKTLVDVRLVLVQLVKQKVQLWRSNLNLQFKPNESVVSLQEFCLSSHAERSSQDVDLLKENHYLIQAGKLLRQLTPVLNGTDGMSFLSYCSIIIVSVLTPLLLYWKLDTQIQW
jgi:hypothetical protein